MTVVSNSNLDASSSSSPPRLSETRKSSYTKKSKKYKQSHASSSSNKKKSSTKRIIIDPTLELDQAIISELVKSRSEEIVVGSFESGGSFSRRDSDSISRSDIPDSRTQSSTSLAFENAPSSPPFQPRMKSSGGGGDGDNSSHHSNSGFTSALSSPLKTKFSIPASELSVAARKLSLKEEPEQQSQTGIFEFSDEVVISPSSSSQPTRIPASRNNYSYPNNLASSKSATSSFSSKHYFTTIASSSSSSPPPPSTATATSALAGTTPPTALVANPSLLGQDLRKKVEALKTEAAGSEKNWIKLYSEMYANDNPATSGQLGTSPVASSLPKSLRDQDKTVATGSDGRIEEEQTPTVGSLLSSSLKSNSSANAVSQSAEVAGDGGGNGNSLSPTRLVLIPNLKSNFKASAVSESSDNAAGQSSKVDQPSSTAASRSYDRKGKSAFSNAEDVDARIGGMDWGATGQTSMLSTSAPKQLQQSISPVLSPISPEASSSSTSQFTSIGPYRKLFEYPRRQQHQSTKRVPASGKASSLLSDPTSKSFLRSTSGPDVEIGSASDIFIISSSKNNNSTHMPSDVRVLPPLSIVAEGSATGAVNNRSPSSITAMSAARAAYAHSGGGSSRSTQHPGINGGRSGWAGGLVAGSSVPHSIPPSLILSRPLASSIVKYTRNGTGSISSKDSTNYTYSVSGYASSYHPSSSRFAGSVYDDGTNNHSNEPTDAVPLPHAPSIPFMEVTNSLKLFLKFQVFESDSENIMAWIPCSFVKQLPLYLTEGPNESFGVLSDPATFRLSESGYLDGKKRDVLSGMAWILSTLASLSSIQRREMASNSGAVNGLAASLLMSSMPSTKRSSAAVNVTTIGGKVKSFTPLQNLDRMHPMEKPCYILLTDSNFYIFKPRFSIPYNPASGINMYSHYVQEALQQVRYDDPNELISLVCKIPLENLGRLDIGPNWQYFTIHHLNSKSSASSPSSTTTANQSTFSSTSSSSSSPESSKKTFTSYTILTRDKEATKLAVESLQTLFYGSSPSLELGRRVDTMNGRVQIVNDQREWFYRYLREQVFLEKDRSRGNILFNGPGLSRKYLDFEEGGMDDSEQPNKKESASKSSSTTGVGNWWSNWFSGGGGSGSTQSIIPPPHPPPASTETSSSPSPHLLPSNHGPYQVINSSEDYDPASNQSTEELESSPSSNILYELVGWVISPLKSSSASSKLPIPPVLRTVSLVGSQDYLYLLLERFDVWPTLLDSESLFESPTSTRPTTSSSISKPRQPKNFAISSLFPKKEEWDMFRGKKGLVSDIILPGSKNSILKCARIKDIVRCERWRAWR